MVLFNRKSKQMKLKIEAIIEVDEALWFNDLEEKEWFEDILNDKEGTFLQLWSNEVGDEIGQTSEFKYEIL
jgi:hypothetical protein